MKQKNKKLEFTLPVGKPVSVKENVPLAVYISQRIKDIQKQKKISSRELYFKSNVSNETMVARIRKGSHLISIDTLYSICKGLDCKSSEILPF